MATLKLRVSDKILNKVLWLLSQFKSEDLEILESDQAFEQHKAYLAKEFKRLKSGKARMYSLEEADEALEKTIRKHED